MKQTTTSRALPLALTMAIALFAALAALAVSGGHDAHATGTPAHHESATISRSELVLRTSMRKLWEDHVTWTRLAIISLTTGSPDAQATVGRLLRNQADIGNAIKPFYGNEAGKQLTALLRQHILIAADLVTAAKGGDQAKVADAQGRWQVNADQIAGFLNKANPRVWKLAPMRAMLREHLELTTAAAVARLQGNWTRDVAVYDQIHAQALHMADMLSAGIVEQFPNRFR